MRCFLRSVFAAHIALAILSASAFAGKVVHVVPPGHKVQPPPAPGEQVLNGIGEMYNVLRDDDGSISEVIIHDGEYVSGFSNVLPKAIAPESAQKHPLLIRAAEGARPVLIGSVPIEQATSADGLWSVPFTQIGNELPKVFNPVTRVRYRYVADIAAVKYFPASFTVQDGRLRLRLADGDAIKDIRRNHDYLDYGFFIDRPYVTVRGMAFRDYLARDKWSTAIQLRGHHVVVEDCTATNCSIGFTIMGPSNTVRGCRVEDCAEGVYVGEPEATIENCRLFKVRDRYMVPAYAQDDAGIQFYYPAKGGVIRGNLAVGFQRGIFIKSHSAPYLIEHNTIDGVGQGAGFGATKWGAGQQFRYNIIVNCGRALEIPSTTPPAEVHHNCFFKSEDKDHPRIGVDELVADPKFAAPQSWDYRLQNGSPYLTLANGKPYGALPAIGEAKPLTATIARNDTVDKTEEMPAQTAAFKRESDAPRQWFVAQSGRDGNDGTQAKPIRTVQFAIDQSRPGDEIILQPGIYPHPITITRGGTAEKPIVIRAAQKWKAILDGNGEVHTMIRIAEAPYIVLRDLEVRWYKHTAISINKSPHVTMEGCRVWNGTWYGSWPTGIAVNAEQSPGFVGTGNILFKQEQGFWLSGCPGTTLTNNTCVANMYAAAAFRYSAAGSVCRNNNFAFAGSDALLIEESPDWSAKIKAFDCDYNNYGTPIGQAPAGQPFDTITPRKHETFLDSGAKSIVNFTEYKNKSEIKRFVTMKAWRELSGLDQHSIFADPLFVDAANRDFRVQHDSPNVGAGKDGATIGACEAVPNKK